MPKEFIAAIELGSSKITGIAGRKNMDGSITVLQVVKENTNGCIRKGIVYNIDKTEALLKNIINRLTTSLRCEIKRVYVGAGGQSIRSLRNVINKTFDVETVVTGEMVDELMDSNRCMQYPEQEIISQVTQEYKVDQQFQLDPVGIQCKRLEGNFLNILWRKTFYLKLNQCFKDTGISIAEMYLAPLVLAESILNESEKRNGCVLVDIGAETTTVSTYYRNLLRHLAVIPLGSSNINKDLTTRQIDDAEAEELKLKYASAYTDESSSNDTLEYHIGNDRAISASDFNNVVEARMYEIIRNAWSQVPEEYTDKLLGGIIITGGCSNMDNIIKAFQYHTRKEKVRIARTVTYTVDSNHPDITAQDGTMNTILALLAKGDMNCAGKELNSSPDMFEPKENTPEDDIEEKHPEPRDPNKLGPETIQTEEEKKAREAEKKRRETEKQALLDEIKKRKEEEERQRREKSFFNRLKRNIKDLTKKIMEEEKDTN